MKKICFITVQKAPNFGACLQCYALYKVLTDFGYDCVCIDLLRPFHKHFKQTPGYEPFYVKRKSLKYRLLSFLKSAYKSLTYICHLDNGYHDRKYKANSLFKEFNSQIKYTKTYYSIKELYSNPPVADCYITGSDQLWNPTQNYALEPYFLTFAKQGKKISYATSIGITNLGANIKLLFRQWLQEYDIISVREPEAKNIIESLTGKKAFIVSDPTVLVKPEYWKKIARERKIEREYIFLFTLYPIKELKDFAVSLSKEYNYKLIIWSESYNEKSCVDYDVVGDIGPYEWLGLIKKAKLVITNSFHGTLLSIIMGRNFYTYNKDKTRSSRIINLLNHYNLSDRILTSTSLSSINIVDKGIDYETINFQLEEDRRISLKFLSDAIEKTNFTYK